MERSDMGTIRHRGTDFGVSREGIPLTAYLPETQRSEILVVASIHGDEAETTVVLSDALRSIAPVDLKNAAVLCANPDGILRGTRGNATGVDLNRNFPAANWSPEPVAYKSRRQGPRDIELSPGADPASEPETRALLSLIERIQPRAVVSLHAALACIDDAGASLLGKNIAERTGLPLEADIGYPTPGSFGSWAGERDLCVVTYEFEAASLYDLKDRHAPVLADLLTGSLGFGD